MDQQLWNSKNVAIIYETTDPSAWPLLRFWKEYIIKIGAT